MLPDNYSQWEAHEREQEAWLAKRLMCDYCEQNIQDDHYFDINGEVVCPDCMESCFRKEIE